MDLNIFRTIKLYFSSDKYLFQSIKNIFGFYPKNISLYKLALLHRSVAEEIHNGIKLSNERLEYLGDAILSAIIADVLFKKFPFADEGFLTEMRSKIVSGSSLNKLSQKLGIDKHIQTNKDNTSLYRSIRGDALEAIFGAIYLDKGYNATKRILVKNVLNIHIDIDALVKTETNFKSKLIEWVQKEKKTIEFRVVEEIGNGFKKQYLIEVLIDGIRKSIGCDYSIKGAEQIASEKAFNIMITN